MSEAEQVEQLARAVRALQAQVEGLRRDVQRLAEPRAVPAPVAVARVALRPPDPVERVARPVAPPRGPRFTVDIESIVGRYGTLALATLAILLGVGSFVNWAIAHGLLVPWVRVALGLLAAVAIGVAGMRVRPHARPFGNALLALALAIVHVNAWGAGPVLGLVPGWAALAVAGAASAVLSVFALVQGEQTLFSLGVGGALIAPFVTTYGPPRIVALLSYGYCVIALAMSAIKSREWRLPTWLLAAGCPIYVVAALEAGTTLDPWIPALLPAAFALACAITALRSVIPARRTVVAHVALGALLLGLGLRAADRLSLGIVILAAAGTVTAYASLRTIDAEAIVARLLASVVFPLGFLATAAYVAPNRDIAALIALAWMGGAIGMAFNSDPANEAGGLDLAVAALAGSAAIVLATQERSAPLCITLLAGAAATGAYVMMRWRIAALAVPVALNLLVTAGWAANLLIYRPHYGYIPFASSPGVAAGATSAAWIMSAWCASRFTAKDGTAVLDTRWRTGLWVVAVLVAFLWGRDECGHAFSPDIATFLLIAYYAITGVAAIFVGRARALPVVRHAGLVVAIYAALKSIAQASDLVIVPRLGSYFVVGLFLLAVAYWYRARVQGA